MLRFTNLRSRISLDFTSVADINTTKINWKDIDIGIYSKAQNFKFKLYYDSSEPKTKLYVRFFYLECLQIWKS